MSTDPDAAARRIMNQFGEESRIPYLNIEEGDVGVLIAFPIIGLFIASLTGVESLALPFVAGGLGFGVAVIYVSPDHLNAWTWTKDVYRYAKRPRVTFSAPEAANSTTNETERNKGGLANYAIQTGRANAGSDEHQAGVARCWRDPTDGRHDGGFHRDRPGEHGLRDVQRLGPASERG